MVYILPNIEQGALHSKWQFTGNSGFNNTSNRTLISNVTIPVYRCPSSSAPKTNGWSGYVTMNTSYTGIAGAVGGTSVNMNGTCCNGSGNILSNSGILFGGSRVALTEITDGTSNTWMVAEQSDHLRDANGAPLIAGYTAGWGNSGGLYGWSMGAQYSGTGWSNGQDGRQFNCTTVRYQINQRGVVAAGTDGASAAAAAAGVNNDAGNNFPLNSTHTGGVNILSGDGTVRFYANNLSMAIIQAYCTRSGSEPNLDSGQ
jgi:hypothetical protein